MVKPLLPRAVVAMLPKEVVGHIYRFVPHTPKQTMSPSLQKALASLQRSPKRNAMDLYGFDDFVLC
jgi:hypothetical protein